MREMCTVEPHERLLGSIVEIDWVARRHGIVPLAPKLNLNVLEGSGHFDAVGDAHEHSGLA
jgi:hypothetical protein